ncbi:unnamed protein product [Discula destructiva]
MPPSVDGARPTKVLSRASTARSGPVKGALEYGYPHGHLGHLTPDEETTFSAFKALLASKDLYQPGPPPSPDDATIVRFLRARRWDIPSAHAQFAATAAWRRAMDLDTLYDTIDVASYEASRRLYPQWTGRRDRRGIPIYLFEIAHLDPKSVAAYEKTEAWSRAKKPSNPKDAKLVRLFALYENLTRFAQPLCTQLTDREYAGRTPVTLSTNIVDVTGVSLKGYWNLKGHMQAASELATAHYPETLDRIFIIGAPSFFTTVWGWIKRWFDPVTVSKIFILSQAEVLPTLKSFMDVRNIPKKYGGELDFKWSDRPNLDDTIRSAVDWQNGHTEFPDGPVYWVPIEGGTRLQCMARGSVDKKERDEVVGTIAVAVATQEEEEEEVNQESNGVAAAEVAPKTDEQQQQLQQQPAEEDAVVPPEDVTSPATDKFVDAPEIPPAAPSPMPPAEVLVPGAQDLSLGEKALEAGQAAVSNGKAVTTA